VIKDTILRYAIFGLQKGFQKLAFWLWTSVVSVLQTNCSE
jgi:hypothetical protein